MVEVGEEMPRASLFDTDLKKVSLARAVKNRVTVLAFFPGAFTGVCTKELCTFRDSLSNFNSMNASILAISVDSPFANKAFKDANNLNFTLLSDPRRKAVKKFGIPLKDFAGIKGYVAAKRAVFVIGKDSRVAYKWVTEDPAVEPNYDEVKAALAGMQ
jgi:peroxiredoxin